MARHAALMLALVASLVALSALIFEADSGYEGGGTRSSPRLRSAHAWQLPSSNPEPPSSSVQQPPPLEASLLLAVGVAVVSVLAGILVYQDRRTRPST